jgi:aspartyl-tRNA(Asn)/glutamyl-tRNA(Gln) amidotransferase subunit A
MYTETAQELAKKIKEKKISVQEAAESCIKNIEKYNKNFNTFITVANKSYLDKAKEIQARIDKGEELSSLAGVPVALKDNILTKGIRTTCASKMLGNFEPVFNATVAEKLENAGMLVIGKLNMDEFAAGGCEEFGAVCNPWNVTRIAAEGAAIAAGQAPLALAGGGVRKTGSFCGVTEIKPTYGSVSRFGITAFTSSFDQASPVGQDINDCAALLSVISGPDEKDGTCVIKEPFNFDDSKNDKADVHGVKIGIMQNFHANDDVKNAVLASAKEFEAAGALVENFEMPFMDYIIPVYYIIGCAEASSNLAKYDGLKYGYRSPDAKTLSDVYRLSRSEGFGFDIKKRIMLGSLVLSSDYYDAYFRKALQARTLIKDAYNKLFERFDLIISPFAPVVSQKPDEPAAEDIYAASVNLAGLPAATLPCGFDSLGMPVGFQLIGSAFCENKIVNAARVYQSRTDYHKKRTVL